MEPPITCRACLTEITLQYISLDTCLYDTTVLEVFNFCTKLKASLDDEFPTSMCIPCGTSLQTAYDFIKTAYETDQFLRGNISSQTEKEEDDDSYKKVIQTIAKIETDSEKEYLEEYIDDNIDDNDSIEIKKENGEVKLEVVSPTPKEEIDIEFIEDGSQCYIESMTNSEVPEESTELDDFNLKNEDDDDCSRSGNSCSNDEFMEEIEDDTYCEKPKKAEPMKNKQNKKVNRLYKCDTCEKPFKNMFSRNKHEFLEHKDSEQRNCKLCPFSTSSHSSWQTHRYRHENPTQKKYLCSFCPKTFTNPKSLKVHEDYLHGDKEWAAKCEKCHKKFMNKQKLEYHILSVHSNGRNYHCPDCPKTFKNSFQLKSHQKLHTDRTIECPECEKKFVRRVDLKVHMRIHTGELPYQCHLCDKSYRIKVRLTYHLQKHLGTKHVCDFCSSEFNSKPKLRLHMFEHIGMPYVCDQCHMGFTNRAGLGRHTKSIHNITMTDEELLQNRLKNEKFIKRGIVSDDALIDNSNADPISMEYIDLDTPFNESTYFDCFNYCTKLEAKASDNLPKAICISCSNLMQMAYDFITAALEADRLFRECVLQLEECEEDIKIMKNDLEDLDEIIPKKYIVTSSFPVEEEIIVTDIKPIKLINDKQKFDDGSLIQNTVEEYEIVEEYQTHCSPTTSEGVDKGEDENELQESALQFLTKNVMQRENIMPSMNKEQQSEIMEEETDLIVDEPNEVSVVAELDRVDNFDNNSIDDAAEDDQSEKSSNEKQLSNECPICKKIVRKNMADHIRECYGTQPYTCEKCDASFFYVKDLRNHTIKKHNKFEDSWYCNLCGEALLSRADLSLHRNKDHRDKTPGLCITCGSSFDDQNALTEHVTKEHWSRKRPVECPHCKKKFQLNTLPQHVRFAHIDIVNASGDKQFTCKYCFKNFEDTRELEEHTKTHTGTLEFSCEICGQDFTGKRTFDKHVEQMHPTPGDEEYAKKCPKCDFTTSNEALLLKHKKRHYNNDYYKTNFKRYTSNKKKLNQYLCSFCPKKYNNSKSLRDHEDFKHGDKKAGHECDVCGKKYYNKCALRNHKKSAHGVERPFLCEECPKAFKLRSQLVQHIRFHSERNIACPYCDKKFLLPCYLKVHLRTHTNEQPYACHLCDKRFAIKVRLTYHLAKHDGVVVKCEYCPETFKNKASLRIHRFEHIGYPFVCDICQEKHHRRIGLARHMKRSHGLIYTEEDINENRFRNMKKIYGRTDDNPDVEPVPHPQPQPDNTNEI
ncbi:zinc finger protein 208-like [Episyrphus balteatus]|uniref:zinc finger protein 208-like n=1 Tax=Episyrphus balteatus TaxID=286459 RepID=UPI0024867036|nr:zinc finger protein 208-like [Episyrphus balteatus]